jgi:hypothetical protein
VFGKAGGRECRTADQHGTALDDLALDDTALLVGELGAPRLRDHMTMTIANDNPG